MQEETLDIVNDQDEVIGRATRKEVYQKRLQHRIVHVLIFNKQDEMLLQLRAKTVSFCPLHWSTAVGGHVQTGESYEEAADRECVEELGKTTKLEFFSKDRYQIEGVKKFLVVYKAKTDQVFEAGEEVERIDYFSINKIKEMKNNGEEFHPELLFLLEKHFF